MATHPAVVTVAVHAPLEIHQVPTVAPGVGEVRVRVEWTASTPLDLHQNDGGLLVKHPQVLGDGVAGTVVEVGPEVKNLRHGDKVFGFGWREQKEKAYQEFATLPEILLGKLPPGLTLQEAVTVPNNFVTVFHTLTADLGLHLPWPKPANYDPPQANDRILVWGGSSSVGQYAIQVLRYYGYQNIFTTASAKHHKTMRGLGAAQAFDYRSPKVTDDILEACSSTRDGQPAIPLILDCIGSLKGTLEPVVRIAQKGSKVAVLLPIIVRDSTVDAMPEYAMDVDAAIQWPEGVKPVGVRTHFYLQNAFFRDHLQSSIMPAMLAQGIIKPNAQRVVQGKTLLERAQNAMDALRRKDVSGERLVWRVAED